MDQGYFDHHFKLLDMKLERISERMESVHCLSRAVARGVARVSEVVGIPRDEAWEDLSAYDQNVFDKIKAIVEKGREEAAAKKIPDSASDT